MSEAPERGKSCYSRFYVIMAAFAVGYILLAPIGMSLV
ncbi:MAG: hypothetical protein ACI8XO_003250 [Verrucomicrobiales bacterium]|jgi:hypothetical protein